MKQLEQKAITDLIAFYSLFIKENDLSLIKMLAIKIQGKYLTADTLLSDKVNVAVNKLTDIYAETGIKPPTKEEAKEILEKLKKREEELKK